MIKAVKVNESCYDLFWKGKYVGMAEKWEDGHFYWGSLAGPRWCWSSEALHTIATTLESLNREWDNTVQNELSKSAGDTT